jgi:hypothetical protein
VSAVRSVVFKDYDLPVRQATPEVIWSEGEVITNLPESIKEPAVLRAYAALFVAMADEMERGA